MIAKTRLRPSLWAALVICAWLAACGSPQAVVSASYKTLRVSALAYDATMKSAADLYHQGQLDKEARDRVTHLAAEFVKAYGVASLTLADYADAVQNQDAAATALAKERLDHDLGLAASLLAELVSASHPAEGVKP